MNNMLAKVLILISISIGVSLTLYGLWLMPWPAALAFGWSNLFSYSYTVFLMIGGATAIALAARWAKLNAIVVGSGISCIIVVITGAIWPAIVTIWFAISSYVLGLYFIRFLKIDATKITGITAFLVGACFYGTAVGLAAHFPVNYPGLYGFALAVPVLLGWRSIHAAIFSFRECLISPSETKLLDLAIASIALVYFSVALMPEVGHDALAMHLFIPGHLATRHEWSFDVNTYVWAVMPMMGDWLFSVGYMLAGEQAARLINVGFIFVLGWLIRDLVLWAGGNAVGARWAVLLFLTTPLTFTEGSSLFIESIWATFVVAGSLAVFKLLQSDEEQAIHLPLAGIFLGGALAAKAVTLTILPAFFLVLLWRYREWAKPQLIGTFALGLALFLAIGSIPYATALYHTANPIFPFFNNIFQSPFYPAVAFDNSLFSEGLTWDIFYQVTFHSDKFLEGGMGSAGFQWLLLFTPALLILVAARHSRGLVLFAVAMLSVAVTFQSLAYLRYVFPSFAWVAAGIGVAFSASYQGSISIRRFLYVIGWSVILLNFAFFKAGTNYGHLSLQPLLSESGREAYLNNRVPIRNVVELVNDLNSGRSPVAVFSSPLTAGLNSDALYANWYNYRFQNKVSDTKTSNDMAQLLIDHGVDYVILDSEWGASDKRTLIEAATQQLAVFGGITIRKLIDSYRFQTELLKNPDFRSFDGWSFSTDFAQTTGRALVTVTAPAAQSVSVVPGRRYQNSVSAMCADQPAQGRVQTNWVDSKGGFITASIHVFDCTPEEATQSIEVTAPANASSAIVYATGHSNVPIIMTEVYFRQ